MKWKGYHNSLIWIDKKDIVQKSVSTFLNHMNFIVEK